MCDEKVVRFLPMHSFVNPTFWHKFAESKLEHDRLDDKPKQIWGSYTNRNSSLHIDVDYTAFNM